MLSYNLLISWLVAIATTYMVTSPPVSSKPIVKRFVTASIENPCGQPIMRYPHGSSVNDDSVSSVLISNINNKIVDGHAFLHRESNIMAELTSLFHLMRISELDNFTFISLQEEEESTTTPSVEEYRSYYDVLTEQVLYIGHIIDDSTLLSQLTDMGNIVTELNILKRYIHSVRCAIQMYLVSMRRNNIEFGVPVLDPSFHNWDGNHQMEVARAYFLVCDIKRVFAHLKQRLIGQHS